MSHESFFPTNLLVTPKAQVLADLETDGEVIIDVKYIKYIWQDMGSLIAWCEAWSLTYEFFQEEDITRTIRGLKTPIRWLKITRGAKQAELVDEDNLKEERTIIDETDARL